MLQAEKLEKLAVSFKIANPLDMRSRLSNLEFKDAYFIDLELPTGLQ